jgi:anti-sigma factor RsiW
MKCRDVLELVEAIAAGDIAADAALGAHLESCPGCASTLAAARRIEALLGGREARNAPARFTPSVLQRIRREEWRSEQRVDRVFNVAIALALLLVAGGGAALLNLAGLARAFSAAWEMAAGVGSTAARTAAPSLNTYIAAAALLVSALGMWWWADRTISM